MTEAPPPARPERAGSMLAEALNHRLVAVLGPAVVGFAAALVAVKGFEWYGWSLFLALPVIVGFLSAFCWSFRRRRSFASTYGTVTLAILALGVFALVLALDGAICLLMALPLALALALPGALLGRALGAALGARGAGAVAMLLVAAFPFLVGFERAVSPPPVLREVTTRVRIAAPIERVWETVVAFPRIDAPPGGVFRWGIAYPIEARIEGEGVGAVRYCTFSTGSFVEPVTRWQPPSHLAFDVVENPPPMREWSPYRDLSEAHLHGHFESRRGEFRLTEIEGGTELAGTTWYSHSLAPEFYWGAISDRIIHAIHRRVLDHIRAASEAAPAESARESDSGAARRVPRGPAPAER